jgi:tetratricopeptide (TPR) repeat protein
MFADHVHYREYQRLLVELHGLIASGRNQSPEARDLRHRMEQIEVHLSEDEIVRLNALSADLSMIHDREIPDPDVVARVLPQDLPRLIESSYMRRKWEDVLELLRAGLTHLWRPDQIAYVRSRAYEELSELAPAVAFMDEAARRAPSREMYRALALRLLWESKRYQEAYFRARDYLADPTIKSRLILMSGGVVAQQSIRLPEPPDLKTVSTTAVYRIQQALPQETSPSLIFAGLVALGLLAVHVDDTGSAVDAFRKALEVETTSDGQVTSTWLLNNELEMLRSGKAKTVEERSNALHLAEVVQPSAFAVAA